MCGRYASTREPDDLVEEFDVLERHLAAPLEPDYNVAPTKPVYAVLDRPPRRSEDGEASAPVRQLRSLTWGLVPSWAKDPSIGSRLINARSETVAEKPSFRRAFAARRCILPADGYYEWYAATPAGGKQRKQPFFIRPRDGGTLAMAGLYEIWRDPERADDDPDRFRWTCTVITTEAEDELGRIHDRMPLMVTSERRDAWLDPRTPVAGLLDLLEPASPGVLEAFAVSTAVGNVRNNGPDLVRPLADDDVWELA
ncbi:SOS response-associated peptidase [Nocardioides sp. R-C-SC26]|uniref:SOS response-associated peptidase n=1 Tax=Nocardioides sp. R-C-SC26 TaxID=2870414 RepID=UPI001E60ACA4|nr:SOS response-associated peptidase [Nocardioides sp. R-C-SC26]